MQFYRFRCGDADEFGLGLRAGLMLYDVVHPVQSGEKCCEIVAEVAERSLEKAHASSTDQLLSEVIEKRAHVYVWKSSAELASLPCGPDPVGSHSRKRARALREIGLFTAKR